ncbi:GspE/PulE family protein [Clostridium aestuarii]|uniref:GspE/PulE family protein n=1 Tax=Clostridium aestuarii TaxID=338193 RepID=A0ABT4CXP3_9CLOT|nr:GspE/PulE family protein [Clostridium aestuarii]MCY6483736.1 GspE/PulE family protein [Clostridium aestuarii]
MLVKLEDMLLKDQIITLDEYRKVLQIKNKTNEEIEEILLSNSIVKKDIIYKVLKRKYKIDSIQLDSIIIPSNVIKLLPEEIVKKHSIIPFSIKENKICLAMVDPLNFSVIDDIKFMTNKEVIPYIEIKKNILFSIENYYSREVARETLEVLEENSTNDDKENELNYDDIENAPIVRLTNLIINQAINEKASDIHLEPFKDEVRIRFRIDGILKEKRNISNKIYSAVCKRIKIISGMDISKKMIPQDGKIEFKNKNKLFDFRVSSMPTIYGEKLVIRILYKGSNNICLDNLKLEDKEKDIIKRILKNPCGIVLVTGPTNSGKTTTLCALLNALNSEEKNIITIEDPVEYTIPGINQVNVNTKAGLTFALGLRSILRQDPDVIMVGEIRDEETAEIAVKAAITGHLVLATLHTNDAPSAVERLIDMNVPQYLVADALVAVIAQRLVREICPYCKEVCSHIEQETQSLEISFEKQLYRGRGCEKCNKTGYKGRRAVFEIMYLSNEQKKLIWQKRSIDELRKQSIKNGMIPLNVRCKEMAKNGITTFEEMTKVSYESI